MSNNFRDLGIQTSLQSALNNMGFTQPTSIQKQVVPYILNETEDLVALAQTGTGKTAAFGLPLLQLTDLSTDTLQTVILAPTRELGQQIFEQLNAFTARSNSYEIALLTGGSSLKDQIESLKSGIQIAVATPGRFIDLIEQQAIHPEEIQNFVLDEADEMIQAFEPALLKIFSALPQSRRTFMFSATMSGELKNIVHNYMSKNPMYITAEMESLGKKDISHQYVVVAPIEKLDVLLYFLNTQGSGRGIIFCRTKAAVNKLAKNLAKRKISSGALHGSLTQGIRDRIMNQFRAGHINILVATDLVARGIDVKELSFIVNYHLPDSATTYVHRSGRTGRAGEKGLSMTILQQEEVSKISEFETELGIKFEAVQKANEQDLRSSNAVVWANQIHKSKLVKDIPATTEKAVKEIFNRLSKEEIIDKILSDYWRQQDK